MASSEAHWNAMYRDKSDSERSWFQAEPARSLSLVGHAGLAPTDPILDVGGGASLLVDRLLDLGYRDITVLDLATSALESVRRRLGKRADAVTLLHADIVRFLPPRRYALWHDRGVFHFLTAAEDRRAYLRALTAGLRPGGYAIFATFAADGPPRCSGLEVARYEPDTLAATVGAGFQLIRSEREAHVTPAGRVQSFQYSLFRAVPRRTLPSSKEPSP